MPGLAGQSLDYRGVKIVTGAIEVASGGPPAWARNLARSKNSLIAKLLLT